MSKNSEIARDLFAAAVYSLLLSSLLSSWTVVVSTGDIQYASLSVTSAVVCYKVFNSSLDCEVSSIGNLGSYGILSQFMVFTGFPLCILNHFFLIPVWKRFRIAASPSLSNRILGCVCVSAFISYSLLFFQILKVWGDFVSDWQSRNKDKLENASVTQTNNQVFAILWIFISLVATFGFRDKELEESRRVEPEQRSQVREVEMKEQLRAEQLSDASLGTEPIELSGIEEPEDQGTRETSNPV